MDQIAVIEQELNDFRNSLTRYREMTESWYARTADAGSRATDLPSLLGMERSIRAGSSSKSVSLGDSDFGLVAQCPLSGILEIESKFESAYEVPLGRIQVDVRSRDDNSLQQTLTLGDDGKASFKGQPGKWYSIQVNSAVSAQQVDELFSRYDGLANQLETWLRGQWAGFRPQWQAHGASSVLSAAGTGILEGSWQAVKDVWEGIKLIFEILQDPMKYAHMLGDKASELAALAKSAPQKMARVMLLASDEAVLYLLLRSATLWLSALPPSQIAGTAAKEISRILVSVLIDILIAIVLTVAVEGTGIAYLAVRLAKYGKRLVDAVIGFVKSVFGILEGVLDYIEKYRVVAARGIASGVQRGKAELIWDARKNSTLREVDARPNVDRQATTPNERPAQACKETCTGGEPVSMVTGEELLTLDDANLDGLLPFVWSRLYRTSAVEVDHGLGYGWSHGLAHSLLIEDGQVTWIDHENRRTSFPLPDRQRPAINNRLSKAAIFIGADPAELVLAQAGDKPRFYHFRHDGKGGDLVAISDAYGNRLHVGRDLAGRISRLSNGAGRALAFRYEHGRIQAVEYQQQVPADTEEASWRSVQTLASYVYNAAGQLLEAHNALGEIERYRYDEQHVILERHLAGGASFYWAWEGAGKQARCVRQWSSIEPLDFQFEWDDEAGTATLLQSDGGRQVFVHDGNARLVRQVDPDGAVHEKAYNPQGQLVAERDPLGAVTEYHYDEAGHLVALVPPEEEPTSFEYRDGFVSAVERGKASWRYRRNAQGDVIQQTDPDGHSTFFRYDERGRLLQIQHPDGSSHQLLWNGLGQLIEERLPDGGVRRYRYDVFGRQITRQDEQGAVTRFEWDALGRLRQVTLPGGASRAYEYNAYGKVTAERDELGRVTRYKYDGGLHLVTRRINPDGSQLRYRYDNARLLLSEIENERGELYRLDYHPSGLISRETGFDGRTCAYAYDLNGHLLEKTEYGEDGSELVTRYQRDASGRLLVRTQPDGSEVHYSYDALGRLVGVDDGEWPLAYEYDLQNRLTREHQGWATLQYGYDALGRLSHCRLPDGSTLDYRHRAGGELSAIDLNGQRLTSHQFSFGRERQRQQGQLLSQYQYDEQGRLLAHQVSQRERALYQRRYSYDAGGNLASVEDSRKGARSYHYDPLDRLVAVRGDLPESFAHDPAGNLLTQNAQQGDPRQVNVQGNRLLMQGDCHYDYDAYGNLLRERRGAGQKLVTQYRYDSQHRLVGVQLPDGRQVSYRYDAFGRRIAKEVDGKTTEFIWQGDRLVAESGQGRYRSYVYEPGSFRPLAMLDGEGPLKAEPFYYQLDHLGTPQELTSYGGEILWSARYRAYGNVARLEVAEIDNPLRFQGQYYDTETGLHYNRHRYYNPNTGRFLTPDPIKLAGGLNHYQYVPNPTGWVDPLGLAQVSNDCPLQRRVELNEKYERTGDLQADITQRGRREVATEFYRSQGFDEASIPGHLNGIDFTQSVNVETLNRGKRVYQYQSPGAPQGNYYSISSSTTPSELGIGALGENRAARTVELKLKGVYLTNEKTKVLKSTAKEIDDTWSVRGISQPSSGGGTQVFTGMKENFEKID